jgi:predicted Zn-dependent protease
MTEERKTLARKAAILASGDAESCEQLIFASLHVGDKETTGKALTRLRQMFPTSSRVDRDEAVAKEGEGSLGEAVELYEKMLRKKPEDVFARKRLACILVAQGKYEEALTYLTEQANIFSSDFEFFHELAVLTMAHTTQSASKALAAFEELVLSQPHSVYTLVTYGELLCTAGEWDAGRKYFAYTLRHKPEDFRALWCLSLALTKTAKKLPEEAKTILRELAKETKSRLTEQYEKLPTSGATRSAALKVIESLRLLE